MDALYHARSCARRYGGDPDEYLTIHLWFDESSNHIDDSRHRMLRHHSLGIKECIDRFGRVLTLKNGKQVPVKQIAELHLIEDLGFVPTVADWVRSLRTQTWMTQRRHRRRVF